MSENGKLMPNLDKNSTNMLNLTVLQRMDPYIDQILITASHVTFYQFNVHLNQWSRKDVEGSLFVVKRNAQPRFQFIIMNRRNTENLVEDLLGDFDYELQVPYLLYRNAAQEVNGICFHNPRECEDVTNLFTRIIGAYSKVAPKPKANKSAFEELEAVPTSAASERPLEPPFTTSSSTDVPEDSSLANFFGTSMKLGHHASSNSVNSVHPYHNSTPTHLHSRVASSPALNNPSLHIPLYTSPTLGIPLHDTSDPLNSNNRATNLIKPLSIFTASSSASPLMPQPSPSVPRAPLRPPRNAQHNHGIPLLLPASPLMPQPSPSVPGAPLQPPRNAQHNHGIPLLQPFPPPTPPSFTPGPTSSPYYGALSRGHVRDALLMLSQDNQFIDMFHQALLKVHQQ